MKKLVIILVSLLFSFSLCSRALSMVDLKINLNLSKDEVGVTFFSLPNSKSILISENEKHYLIIYEYLNSKNIEKYLNIFNANNAYIYSKLDIDIKHYDKLPSIKNVSFNQNVIKIYNYKLCIDSYYKNCNLVYLLSERKINEKVDAIFYESIIDEDKLTNIYNYWSDKYEINNDVFTIIKIKDLNYNVVIIPSTKY